MKRRLTAMGVGAIVFFGLFATESGLAMVWDEGFTIGREERVRAWLSAMVDPPLFAKTWRVPDPEQEYLQLVGGEKAPIPAELTTRSKLLEPAVVEWFWPFAREEPHGHPPFYAEVGLAGDLLLPGLDLLPRARLGPMLFVSLTAGLIYLFVSKRMGHWPGIASAGALLLQPRFFAHAHYAHYDNILTCLWILATLFFTKAVEPSNPPEAPRKVRKLWAILFGLTCGAAAATKLTGWFLPIPFLLWICFHRERRVFWTIVIGGLCAMLTLYVLTPPWWFQPVSGVERFLRSNLTRANTTLIYTMFLGDIVLTPQNSLPWYNTLVWTVFVTPVGFLALAITGAVAIVRKKIGGTLGSLALTSWLFILVLRSLPHTPGHDGERQFLAAFGMLALVASCGAAVVMRWGQFGKLLIGLALLEGVVSISLMYPYLLSYYSPAVGGLPGATRMGMEATYYFDSVTEETLRWLNNNTPQGGKVLFPAYPKNWEYYRKTRKLHVNMYPYEPGRFVWYVAHNRGGSFTPAERRVIEKSGPRYVRVQKFGVPLVWIIPFAELEKAYLEVQSEEKNRQ